VLPTAPSAIRRIPVLRAAKEEAAGMQTVGKDSESFAAKKSPADKKPPPPPLTPEEFEAAEVASDLRPEYGTYWPSPRMKRRAGCIMHPTSLPGAYGVGEIGKESFAFVDWAISAGFSTWQVCTRTKRPSPCIPTEQRSSEPLIDGGRLEDFIYFELHKL
jgi:hypothetical protein